MAFKQGYNLGALWRLDGAGADTTLAIRGYNTDSKCDMLETTNSGSSGVESYLAGIFRVTGKIEAQVNIAAYPWGTIGITAGAKGTLHLQMGGATPEYAHIIIETVTKKSAVNGMLEFEFTYRLDSTANAQTGAYVFQSAA